MIATVLPPGMAFRFQLVYLENDIFLFDHVCTIIEGDGLYRRFNKAGGFLAPEWFRFQQNANHLHLVEEFDFVG